MFPFISFLSRHYKIILPLLYLVNRPFFFYILINQEICILSFTLDQYRKKNEEEETINYFHRWIVKTIFFGPDFIEHLFFYDFYLSWPAVLTFIRKISYFSTCFFIFLIDRSVDVLWCLKTNLFLFNWWKIMLFSNRFVKWWNSLHILSFISNIISIVLWNKRYHFNVIS